MLGKDHFKSPLHQRKQQAYIVYDRQKVGSVSRSHRLHTLQLR
jgi:hypothetical protein